MSYGHSCLSLKKHFCYLVGDGNRNRYWNQKLQDRESLFYGVFIVGQNALLDLLGGMEPGDADAVVQAVTGNQPQQPQQQQGLATTTTTPAASNVNADILDLLGKQKNSQCNPKYTYILKTFSDIYCVLNSNFCGVWRRCLFNHKSVFTYLQREEYDRNSEVNSIICSVVSWAKRFWNTCD